MSLGSSRLVVYSTLDVAFFVKTLTPLRRGNDMLWISADEGHSWITLVNLAQGREIRLPRGATETQLLVDFDR